METSKGPVIIFGHAVAAALATDKARRVKPSAHVAGCYESESLCAWQRELHSRGFETAVIDKTIYGYSLRSMSGLDNFRIIASSRHGQLNGTYEDAERAAEEWQKRDPAHRVVYAPAGSALPKAHV